MLDEIRKLEATTSDLEAMRELLAVFPPAITLPVEEMIKVYRDEILPDPRHNVFIGLKEGKPLGTVTLNIVRVLIHNCALVGFIENVGVPVAYWGNGIGPEMVKFAAHYGFDRNCYKVILSSSIDNFNKVYAGKCGFQLTEVTSRLNRPADWPTLIEI